MWGVVIFFLQHCSLQPEAGLLQGPQSQQRDCAFGEIIRHLQDDVGSSGLELFFSASEIINGLEIVH